MDAKITDVLEELKLKYEEGRITEDQICLKCGKKLTAFSKASLRRTMVFCRSMPTTVCFVKKKKLKKGCESSQRQNENERQNHITRQRIGRPRLKSYAFRLRTKATIAGEI